MMYMNIKQILSLAALAGVTANDAGHDPLDRINRSLQDQDTDVAGALGDADVAGALGDALGGMALPPSALCMMTETEPAKVVPKCCPCADPNDGICTILWCMNLDPDNLALKAETGCACDQIREGCKQVGPLFAMAAAMVDGLPEICEQVGKCCPADEGTDAGAFNECMYAARDAGTISVPNLDAIGGIPVLEGDGVCPEEPAGGEVATDASAETDDEPAKTESDAPAGDVEPVGSEEPDSEAGKYGVNLMALVGVSLVIAMV